MLMEPLILMAGSAAGVLTALTMNRFSNKVTGNNVPAHSTELRRRIVTEAMNRVYDYEREGKISEAEREKLLAKYRHELATINSRTEHYDPREITALRENLIAIMDQRMAQINSKLDDLSSKISNTSHTKYVERKEAPERQEKREAPKAEPKPVQQMAIAENIESEITDDASLDEIKTQIMQALSKLEQAEVD